MKYFEMIFLKIYTGKLGLIRSVTEYFLEDRFLDTNSFVVRRWF